MTTSQMTTAFPLSVGAACRHLSPLRRERIGARIGNRLYATERAPILSPSNRGRGGERSETERGSTSVQPNGEVANV